jgi:hypothetical protein
MEKIANKKYCNSLKANAFTNDLDKYPKKSEILESGLKLLSDVDDNRLVRESNIVYKTDVLVSGSNGVIIKIRV